MNNIKQITRGQLLLVIFVILLVGGIILGINMASNKSYEEYGEFEKELKISAKNYVEQYDISIKKGGEKKIKMATLDDNEPLYSSLKDKCVGYVIVANDDIEGEEYSYQAYIKCGNKYKTSGYIIE